MATSPAPKKSPTYPPPEHPRLHREDAAGRYLGLHGRNLARRRATGDGPRYIKLGKLVYYDTADLDAWLETLKRSSTSEAK